jgi:hypothetical protein
MTTEQDQRLIEIVAQAARSGLAVNIGKLRDDELCRRQRDEAAAGFVDVTIDRNKYGWCVRPLSNLVNGGQRLSDNYPTREEAVAWARDYVSAIPSRRRLMTFRHFPDDPRRGEWVNE